MKKHILILFCLACAFSTAAQNIMDLLAPLVQSTQMDSETRVGLPQQNLAAWGIPPANYSGITPIGNGRFAVVSDKGEADGFYIWKISQDPGTGAVTSVSSEGFFANTVDASSGRDCEGVAYCPKSGCVFISGEADGRILEYDMDGRRTGRELEVPEQLRQTAGNLGFEALAYGGRGRRARFWTTTESTLPADGVAAGPQNPGAQNVLRLQSFRNNLRPSWQIPYTMDAGRSSDFGPTYVFGVPELCALPDGRLLVLEREANIPGVYVGAEVICKLYSIRPHRRKPAPKELVAEWSTTISGAGLNWANYEGMCLGAKLPDGRQTLLLVNDSQGGYTKGPFSLSDFIKVIYL